jgi:hypothetical protein
VVVSLDAAGEGAARACERIQTDRRADFRLGQIDRVCAPAATLPGWVLIRHDVVILSPSAFPWTLDAPRSGRLNSRQLNFMAKNGVQSSVGLFCRFDMHDSLRFRA